MTEPCERVGDVTSCEMSSSRLGESGICPETTLACPWPVAVADAIVRAMLSLRHGTRRDAGWTEAVKSTPIDDREGRELALKNTSF